jgi:hypothetical protein
MRRTSNRVRLSRSGISEPDTTLPCSRHTRALCMRHRSRARSRARACEGEALQLSNVSHCVLCLSWRLRDLDVHAVAAVAVESRQTVVPACRPARLPACSVGSWTDRHNTTWCNGTRCGRVGRTTDDTTRRHDELSAESDFRLSVAEDSACVELTVRRPI